MYDKRIKCEVKIFRMLFNINNYWKNCKGSEVMVSYVVSLYQIIIYLDVLENIVFI